MEQRLDEFLARADADARERGIESRRDWGYWTESDCCQDCPRAQFCEEPCDDWQDWYDELPF